MASCPGQQSLVLTFSASGVSSRHEYEGMQAEEKQPQPKGCVGVGGVSEPACRFGAELLSIPFGKKREKKMDKNELKWRKVWSNVCSGRMGLESGSVSAVGGRCLKRLRLVDLGGDPRDSWC